MTIRFKYLAAASAAAAIALTMVGLSSFRQEAVQAAGNCTVADNTFDTEEKEFARLINEYRAKQSPPLPALTVSVNLNREASWLAKDMADKNYFDHTDSLGRSPETRGADCGTKTGIGENIAAGTVRDTAQEAFDAWKASSGHNQNMLYPTYKQIGIARYYNASSTYSWYWVTDFSLNSDGTNALSGSTPATATPTKTATKGPATATPTKTATKGPATATPTKTATRAAGTATKTPTRAAATATKTPTASASALAAITSPANNATFSSTSMTFYWRAVTGATQYRVYVGTTVGGSNIKNTTTTATSLSVTNLPRGSVPLYVRLWTQTGGVWKYVDYTYTSAK